LFGGYRSLVVVLAANVVSIAGDALTLLAVPWLVLESTGSAARAGIVAFCTVLPVVVSAVLGGPVIDRIGRRRVSVLADLVSAAVVAAVPVLLDLGVLRFWMLCALMAVTGLLRAPGETARGVLLPALAERAGMPLIRAAGLYDGAARGAATIGAALGGILIATLGAGNVLFVDAATFATSALLVAVGLRDLPHARFPPRVSRVPPRAYRRELAAGYRHVFASPLLLGVCLMALVTKALDQGWSAVLLPVTARDRLGGVVDLGVLEAAFAAGALAGALVYAAVGGRVRRWPVFTAAFLIVGAPRFVVAAVSHSVVPLAVMMAVEGLACGVLNPILATAMYEAVPDELRSRVLSATTASVLAISPLGALATGFFVGSAGLLTTTLAAGGVYLLATLGPLIVPAFRQLDRGSTAGREP
jgi:MFS family permease